jgi:AraC-like DNA-binding protein
MLYILSGKGAFQSGNSIRDLSAGDLIYWPSGTPYRISSAAADGMLFYSVNFDFTQAYANLSETMPPEPVRDFSVENTLRSYQGLDPAFAEIQYFPNVIWAEPLLNTVYTETLQKQQGYSAVQSSAMRILLIGMLRRLHGAEASHPLCRRIEELVEADLSQNNAAIAKKLGYHPYYLNDLLRAQRGITLHQYILSRRLSRAYELINSTDQSLESIAAACGFSSQSYLTRLFRERYRITPLQLRRQN